MPGSASRTKATAAAGIGSFRSVIRLAQPKTFTRLQGHHAPSPTPFFHSSLFTRHSLLFPRNSEPRTRNSELLTSALPPSRSLHQGPDRRRRLRFPPPTAKRCDG